MTLDGKFRADRVLGAQPVYRTMLMDIQIELSLGRGLMSILQKSVVRLYKDRSHQRASEAFNTPRNRVKPMGQKFFTFPLDKLDFACY